MNGFENEWIQGKSRAVVGRSQSSLRRVTRKATTEVAFLRFLPFLEQGFSLLDLPLPEPGTQPLRLKRNPLLILLALERDGTDGFDHCSPEMRSIENAGGLREVPLCFLLDLSGSIGDYHLFQMTDP